MMSSENEYCVFRKSHLPYVKVTKEKGDRLLILVKKFVFHQHCFNCHNLIFTSMRTSDVMYCVFSNPELYEVIYCATSYANT